MTPSLALRFLRNALEKRAISRYDCTWAGKTIMSNELAVAVLGIALVG